MNSELTNVVESAEAERLATGFVFTEGPLWHPDGYWLFVDVRASLIYRLAPGGQPEVVREHSGGSNGMTFDLQGRRLICEGDNRQVTRLEPDGTYTPLAQRLGDKHINRPNDIVTRSDGSIYFTDPVGRLPQAERELDFSGVHRIAPDGTLSNATSETEYPFGARPSWLFHHFWETPGFMTTSTDSRADQRFRQLALTRQPLPDWLTTHATTDCPCGP